MHVRPNNLIPPPFNAESSKMKRSINYHIGTSEAYALCLAQLSITAASLMAQSLLPSSLDAMSLHRAMNGFSNVQVSCSPQ